MQRKDKPFMPLYVQDFLTDEKLMECSASATGVYIRIMCIMHKSEVYGTILLKQKDKQSDKQVQNFASKLAKHLPYEISEILASLKELIFEGCLQIEGDLLIQKRMFNDGKLSAERSGTGHLGGVATQQKIKNFAKAKVKANIAANTDIDIDNEIETNKRDKIVKKREKPAKEIKDPFDGKLGMWETWKDYKKKEKKFQFKTDISENQALEDLYELCGGDITLAEKIIKQSIGKGWSGLFQLNNNYNGTGTKTNRVVARDPVSDKL